MRGFRLRESAARHEIPQTSLDDLARMFSNLDPALVSDVFEQTQSSEDAVMILSSMLPREEDHINDKHHVHRAGRHDDMDDTDGGACWGHGGGEEGSSAASQLGNGEKMDDDMENRGNATRAVSMWDDVLPMDCKRIIWSMLSSKDMARAAATSREWHEYTQEMRSWRTFLTVQRYLQPAALEGLVKSHDQAEKIKIDYRKSSSATVCEAAIFYRTIRRGQDARFIDHATNSISESELGESSRETSDEECPENGQTGQFGHVEGSSVRTAPVQQPKDIRVVLVNSSDACRFDKYELISLLDSLDYVENLSVIDSPSIDDSSIEPLLRYRTHSRLDGDDERPPQSLQKLRSLSLIHTRLSNKGLRDLMLNLSSEELDVSRNRRITELVSPPAGSHLRFLTAKSLPNLAKINLSLGGTRLHKLDLSENHALTECVITASDASQIAAVRQFHDLNLSGCKNLRMLMLDCPNLKTLTCSRCRRLQLVGGFVHGLNVPALETLNVNACREATDEGLNLLLGKVRVKHLNVGGCIRLTRLKVAFREGLTGCTLDAYGCGKLGLIEISGSNGVEKVVTTGCGAAGGVRVIKL